MAEKQILIVEDDGIIADRLQNVLKRFGYHVMGVVATGEKAVEMVDEALPDLVLMDIYLAGELSGIEAAVQMQACRDLPVIYLTAFSDNALLKRAKITAPYGYLVKLVKEHELHATIEMALYRSKLEKKLQENERWLDTTLRSIGDGVIATNGDGSVVFINPLAEALTGWNQEDIIGCNLSRIFHLVEENTGLAIKNPLQRLVEGETDFEEISDTQILQKDGTLLQVDYSIAPLLDDRADIAGAVLVFRDITIRKRTEETLRKLSRATEQSPVSVVITDREGIIEYVNPRFIEITDYSAEHAIGENMRILKTGVHPPEFYTGLWDTISSGEVWKGEICNRKKSGELYWESASISPIRDDEDEITHFVGIKEDITERKRSEEQMSSIVEGTSTKIGEDFFRLLVKHLSAALQVKLAFISEAPDKDEPICRITNMWGDDGFREPFEYDIRGTPCEHVFAGEKTYFPENLQQLFPEDIWLQEEGIHSYFAMPLLDSNGNWLGHLGVMDDKSLERFETAESILRIFAARAGAEMERAQAHEKLQWELAVNAALAELSNVLIDTTFSIEEIAGVTLAYAQELTGSVHGYVSVVDPKTGDNLGHTLTDMMGEQCRVKDLVQGFPIEADGKYASLWGHALNTRQEFYTNSPPAHTSSKGIPDGHIPLQNFLTVPAVLGGELVGQVALANAERGYTDCEQEAIKRLTGLYALAIQRKQGEELLQEAYNVLEQRVEERTAELVEANINLKAEIKERKRYEFEQDAIISINEDLRNVHTCEEMFEVILDQIIELMDAEGALVAVLDKAGSSLNFKLARGVWASATGQSISATDGASAALIAGGQPFSVNGPDAESIVADCQMDLLGDTYAIAGIPLIAEGKPIGALWIGDGTQIVDEDIRLLTAIGEVAANAIYRASLTEELRRQVQRLEALRTIDQAITSDLNLQGTLEIFVKQVKEQLEVDAADVLVLNSATRALEYGAGIGFRSNLVGRSRVRPGEGAAGMSALECKIIHQDNSKENLRVDGNIHKRVGDKFEEYYSAPLVSKGKVKGVLEIYNHSQRDVDREWMNFLETLTTQAAIAIDDVQNIFALRRSNLELEVAYDTTLEGWARALELRDNETEGHSRRVTQKTIELARRMGISDQELVHVRRGALLHDIGKMGIPDSILHKPGPLDDSEWEIMHQHTVNAFRLLSPILYLRPAIDIPYCHHEKCDGSGYPRGLVGEEIPQSARIFAIVDVWDALLSDRPYRDAWPLEKVMDYIKEQSGKHFDPRVVEAFMELSNSRV